MFYDFEIELRKIVLFLYYSLATVYFVFSFDG